MADIEKCYHHPYWASAKSLSVMEEVFLEGIPCTLLKMLTAASGMHSEVSW